MRKQCIPGLPPAIEGLGTRLGTTPTSFTSKVDTVMKQLDYTYAFEFILIPRRQQLDANSALTAIQHALTFDYSGVSLTKRLVS